MEAVEQLKRSQSLLEEQLDASRALCDSMHRDLETLRETERVNKIELSDKDEAISSLQIEKGSLVEEVKTLECKLQVSSGQCQRLKV